MKEACIKATVRAIGMEIKNYEQKLDAAANYYVYESDSFFANYVTTGN